MRNPTDYYLEIKAAAIAKFGMRPAPVADAILAECFPETTYAAKREGCDMTLRLGLIETLKKEFKHAAQPDEFEQYSFEFPESIRDIVPRLKGTSQYVEGYGGYIPNKALFSRSDWLDDARKYKRKKGDEAIAVANVLDEIYAALYGDEDEST